MVVLLLLLLSHRQHRGVLLLTTGTFCRLLNFVRGGCGRVGGRPAARNNSLVVVFTSIAPAATVTAAVHQGGTTVLILNRSMAAVNTIIAVVLLILSLILHVGVVLILPVVLHDLAKVKTAVFVGRMDFPSFLLLVTTISPTTTFLQGRNLQTPDAGMTAECALTAAIVIASEVLARPDFPPPL